jgi:hypothetical protein
MRSAGITPLTKRLSVSDSSQLRGDRNAQTTAARTDALKKKFTIIGELGPVSVAECSDKFPRSPCAEHFFSMLLIGAVLISKNVSAADLPIRAKPAVQRASPLSLADRLRLFEEFQQFLREREMAALSLADLRRELPRLAGHHDKDTSS